MTLDELLAASTIPNGVIDCFVAGEDFSALVPGQAVSLGADQKWYRWDITSGDTNHMLGFMTTPSKTDFPASVRVSGVVWAVCEGGATVQDRMAPCVGGSGNEGKVERWTPGAVTAGFALASAADEEPVPILIMHMIP